MRYLLPLFCLLMVACSSSDESVTPVPDVPKSSFYVVNQGSFYDGIDGSISAVNTETGSVISDAFMAQNGVSLGGTPQGAAKYAGTLYVPAFESGMVWALNAENLSVTGTISTPTPQAVAATADYLFVANNDGNLSVFDRNSLQLVEKIPVGPNPYSLALLGDELFISISDGYNYPTYENGLRLARFSTTDFSRGEDIPVGLNPGQLIATESGKLVVVCSGNYADVPSKVYSVNPATSESSYICDGSFIAVNGNDLLVIHSVTDWTTYETVTTYNLYDSNSGALKRENLLSGDLPTVPINAQFDADGDIYVLADPSAAEYNMPGYVYRYNADGTYNTTYHVGVHPYNIIF